MGKNFEVAVIGAGIAGATLAIALHHRGINVTIYESARAFGEIGAGVSFSPNAVEAMKICHQGVFEAFEKVCTRNVWPSKQKVWFDYVDGFGADTEENNDSAQGQRKIAFTVSNSLGQNGVHRARFLEEMVGLLPDGLAKFGKRVTTIDEPEGGKGKIVLHFTDGTSAETDAVIGCDGIKSAVRRHMFGEDSPYAWPSYSHKYAYRGLVPMKDAIDAIGEEMALNSFMHVSFIFPRPNTTARKALRLTQSTDGTWWTHLDLPSRPWRNIEFGCFQNDLRRLGGSFALDQTRSSRRSPA